MLDIQLPSVPAKFALMSFLAIEIQCKSAQQKYTDAALHLVMCDIHDLVVQPISCTISAHALDHTLHVSWKSNISGS